MFHVGQKVRLVKIKSEYGKLNSEYFIVGETYVVVRIDTELSECKYRIQDPESGDCENVCAEELEPLNGVRKLPEWF